MSSNKITDLINTKSEYKAQLQKNYADANQFYRLNR